jgi:hypothetical protein
MRYRTHLTANGRTDKTYRDASSPREAADRAVRGWRSDARFRSATEHDGYRRYVYGGPRMTDLADVRVYDPAP